VRPTDENQHGSTRPNLVSGSRRPAGGEDNILAKLDRDGAHGAASGSTGGGRRALFALGGLLVLGLVGTLAWLAHENAVTKRVLPGAAVSEVPAAEAPATAMVVAPPVPQAASASAVPAQAALDPREQIVSAQQLAPPAAIANEIDAHAVASTEESGVPPLVLLRPERPAESKPAPAITVPRFAPRPVVAARKAPPAVAAVPKTESQQIDGDVALLSAIIMHASSHAAERAQLESTPCTAGKKCPPKSDAQAAKPAD
jgi:hypothetical protein